MGQWKKLMGKHYCDVQTYLPGMSGFRAVVEGEGELEGSQEGICEFNEAE